MIGIKLANRIDGTSTYIDQQISIVPQSNKYAFIVQPTTSNADLRLKHLFGIDTYDVNIGDVFFKRTC